MVPDIFSYNAVLYGYASSTHVKAPERAEKNIKTTAMLIS